MTITPNKWELDVQGYVNTYNIIDAPSRAFVRNVAKSINDSNTAELRSLLPANLAAWYAADTGVLNSVSPDVAATDTQTVRRWQDLSGNANHYDQSTLALQPTLSSGTISFDGSDDYMEASIAGFSGFTALTIVDLVSSTLAAVADTQTLLCWGFGAIDSAVGGAALSSTTGLFSGEKIIFGASPNTARLASTTYARAANTAQILSSVLSSSGTKLYAGATEQSLNLNNIITTASNITPASLGYTLDNILLMNALKDGSQTLVIGPAARFRERLVFNRALSEAELTNVWNYLRFKWGVSL